MAEWDDFLRDVLPSVPGCPKPVARRAVLDAAIEFCRLSRCWRRRGTPTAVVSGAPLYALDAKDGEEVAGVTRVLLDGRILEATSEMEMDAAHPAWTEEAGTPRGYLLEDARTMRLFPCPDDRAAGMLLTVDVALKPSRAAGECPDFLFEDHVKTVAHGALGQLLATPGKPWSNPGLAAYHQAQFGGGWSEARIRINKSNTNRSLRVRQRPFV